MDNIFKNTGRNDVILSTVVEIKESGRNGSRNLRVASDATPLDFECRTIDRQIDNDAKLC